MAIVSRARAITLGELRHDALATAGCLREMGLQAGDRVGICMEKSVDQVLAIQGVLFANAVVVPILPRLKGPNILYIIENSGTVAMITDGDRLGEVVEFAEITRLFIGHGEVSSEWPNLPSLRRFILPRKLFDRIGYDNVAVIYPSGSTCRPKGILIAQRNLAEGADSVAEYLGRTAGDRIGSIGGWLPILNTRWGA